MVEENKELGVDIIRGDSMCIIRIGKPENPFENFDDPVVALNDEQELQSEKMAQKAFNAFKEFCNE